MKAEQHRAFFNGNIYEEIEKLPRSTRSDEEIDQYLKNEYYPAKNNLPIFDGIEEVLKQLHKDNILVINTSATKESTDDYLKQNKIDQYFDSVWGKETSINKIENFRQIITQYDKASKETLFVTDTVGDVLVADKFGFQIILVSYGYQTRDYFTEVENKVLAIADTPQELAEVIQGKFRKTDNEDK